MGWTLDSLRRLFGEQQGVISPWREFRRGWTIGSVGIDEMALFAEKMLSVGQEVQDSTSAGLSQKAFFWFMVAKGYFACHEPAMTVATRRVADSFSSASRSIFVALSFVFRLFLVRFSIGLR